MTLNWKGAVTPPRVAQVVERMRESDRLEVFHWAGDTPARAVQQALEASDLSICILNEEREAAGLCGVTGYQGGHYRLIWLLGTDELTSTRAHRRLMVQEGRRWVDALLAAGMGPLGNACMWKNATSRRWLRALGFEFGAPYPAGRSAELFVNFWRTA